MNIFIEVKTTNSKSSIIKNNLIKVILTLDTLKEEIDYVQPTITLSKLNIVNSKILSVTEVDLIHENLRAQGDQTDSMESAFHLLSTTVGTNDHFLAFIINVPDFDPALFANLRIEAVITGQKRIKLRGNNFLKGRNKLFAVKTAGKSFGNWSFFKLEQLENLSSDKCILNILEGFDSSCVYETITSHEPIIEMDPSTVFANDVNSTLETSCGVSKRRLTGSFLIIFENCSISIENRMFTNQIIRTVTQPLFIPSAHLEVTQEALEEVINIKSLHLQHQQNLKHPTHLNLKAESHTWTLIGGFSLSSTIILILILYICLKPRNRQTVKIQHATSKLTPSKPRQPFLCYRPPALRDHIPT